MIRFSSNQKELNLEKVPEFKTKGKPVIIIINMKIFILTPYQQKVEFLKVSFSLVLMFKKGLKVLIETIIKDLSIIPIQKSLDIKRIR